MFSEDPKTDEEDKKYRLFSLTKIGYTCENSVLRMAGGWYEHDDTGQEGPLQAEAGERFNAVRKVSESAIAFTWSFKGGPHFLATWGMELFVGRWRTSRKIWHKVSGTIECRGENSFYTVDLAGSQFPSHRVWVDGSLRKTIKQGPFSNLWVPHPTDPDLVM